MKNFLLILLNISIANTAISQDLILKIVSEKNEPVPSAYILNSQFKTIGISDANGIVKLKNLREHTEYLIKKLGFQDGDFHYEGEKELMVTLKSKVLKKVVINSQKPLESVDMDLVTAEELGKLACCNLSESFENSNTVDVNYSDGITGTREIKMLGLGGVYSQQLVESTPYHRGITSKIGLNFVPGPWINSIAVNKGIGSVTDGYDNISGQINVSFPKPLNTRSLSLNAYVSEIGKSDLNVIKGIKLKDNLFTNILAHSAFSLAKFDNNNDGYMDMPVFQTYSLMNKWQFIGDNGFVLNALAQYSHNNNEAGQMDSYEDPFKVNSQFNVAHLSLKTAWLMDAVKESSFAIKSRFTYADKQGNIGKKLQDNNEVYVNISPLYVTKLEDKCQKLVVGGNLIYDNISESLDTLSFENQEFVGGAFGEFTINEETYSILAGLRGDIHNQLGFFLSPRAAVSFKPNKENVLKLNGGFGFRTPSILTESENFLISNRQVTLPNKLEAEKAVNMGMAYKRLLPKLGGKSYIEASYFLTLFQNQLIMNVENPNELKISYLEDNSRAQSFQVEGLWEMSKTLSLKLSYKNDQNVILYDGEKKSLPLLKNNKFLSNLSWNSSNEKFKVSSTLLVNGPSRIPVLYDREESFSPWYPILHAQFKYLPKKNIELYIGAENILSYSQQERIILPEMTESQGFDAAMIWGPLDRRRMYMGVKYYIK